VIKEPHKWQFQTIVTSNMLHCIKSIYNLNPDEMAGLCCRSANG